jgi:hypothetical protein
MLSRGIGIRSSRDPRTPEAVRAEQPWLPGEVAAFYAEQEQQHVVSGLPAMRAQWGVTASFRELEALSPAEFFARYVAASSPAARLRVALATSHRPPADLDHAARVAEPSTRRRRIVLGEVAEGTGTAHVVYRERWGDNEFDGGVRIATLDHVDGRWWLRTDDALLSEQGWSFAWAEESDSDNADG